MNSVKAQPTQHSSSDTTADIHPDKRTRSLRPGPLRGLRIQLIFPYLILTLAIAFIGVFISTVLVVESERERFNNSMMDASRTANDMIAQQESAQLERLRFMVFTDGMAQAMYDRNSQLINDYMRPIVANEKIDLVAALDVTGKEIVSFGKNPEENALYVQQGVDFSGLTGVQKVLAGSTDEQGDKFVELVSMENAGLVLFTIGPVLDQEGRMAGAVLVGSYVDNILTRMKKQALAEVVMVDMQGNLIGSTLEGDEEGFDQITGLVRTLNNQSQTQAIDVTLNQRPMQVAYSQMVIRGQQIGWIGVIGNSDYLVSPAANSRNLLIILFGIGTGLVILIGFLQAQNIAQPILKLRSMSQAVARGELDQSIELRRADEIGELGEAFDTMTLQLRQRTAETERLYEESLKRNKELAETNERLENAQMQLVQSEKLAAIGQLTAGIVHDVKNPFAVIMGMAEVLGEEESLDESTRHGLKVIRESAVKGNNIVSDLLKFARQSRPEMQTGDLRETVQAAMRLTAYLTRRYQTSVELPDAPLMITYDAQQIEQVLINVIQNAVQSMPEGGKLEVLVKGMERETHILIRDNGCGISQENIQRIFDPFFTTKSEGEGTGLGLSVSYGIIANHNGRIDVASSLGEGTTFTIILPNEQPAATGAEGG